MTQPAEKVEQGGGTVVLGVTSSIAAYKAADLTSRMVQAGIDVHVIMTEHATRLVQPQTFLTLSRNPVTTSLWNIPDWRPEHIALADKTHLLVIAPATANILGKIAHGIADDALSTFALTHEGVTVVAPAMNPRMWRSAAVQENCRILRERGVVFVGPEAGRVACSGDGEPGRLAEVSCILRAVQVRLAGLHLGPQAQRKLKILITAGPTREHLDPVRFLSNRSTGKMGYAVTEVAAAAGHETILISGPTALAEPAGCRYIPVESAADMAAAVRQEFPECDVLVMCAAVCDFRPADRAGQKLKKAKGIPTLDLEQTEDILGAVVNLKKAGQKIVGFAAETEELEENARRKLREKNLDMVVANDVSGPDTGFAADANEVTLFSASGSCEKLPRMPKLDVAAHILQAILHVPC